MKAALISLAASAGLISFPAFSACEMPTLVADIPDGTTASEAELLAAQARVRAYIAAMDEYIACENEELRTSGSNATSEYWFQMTTRIKTAQTEVDMVAARFNEQVTAFRATRPQSAVPPPAGFVPQQPGAGSPGPGGVASQPGEFAPQPGGVAPPQGGTAPGQGGLAPQQPGGPPPGNRPPQ